MDHDAIMGKIKVKYGISVSITIENVNKWLELTNKKIQDGIVPEQAGVESAKEVFININKVISKIEKHLKIKPQKLNKNEYISVYKVYNLYCRGFFTTRYFKMLKLIGLY
jgi:hypothetical protein